MQINCLDGSPDGKLIVSGSQDATVKVRNNIYFIYYN